MKVWMAVVLLFALLVPVAQAEQAPEERVTEIAARTAYILDYDWDRMPDWNAREYLEAPGTVATLYCESTSADALISLVPPRFCRKRVGLSLAAHDEQHGCYGGARNGGPRVVASAVGRNGRGHDAGIRLCEWLLYQ